MPPPLVVSSIAARRNGHGCDAGGVVLPWENLFPFGRSALLLLNPKVLLPWLLLITAVASLVVGAMAALRWED